MGGVCVCVALIVAENCNQLQHFSTVDPTCATTSLVFVVVQLGVTLVWQPYVHATFTAEPRGMLADRAANVYLYSDMCSTKDADS